MEKELEGLNYLQRISKKEAITFRGTHADYVTVKFTKNGSKFPEYYEAQLSELIAADESSGDGGQFFEEFYSEQDVQEYFEGLDMDDPDTCAQYDKVSELVKKNQGAAVCLFSPNGSLPEYGVNVDYIVEYLCESLYGDEGFAEIYAGWRRD